MAENRNDSRNIDEIAKGIARQYMAEKNKENAASLEQLREKKIQMRNKVIIWAVAGILMVASLVYMGVAWYTRISNTHAVTFEVADYELAVNDNTDNEFLVNIYDYSNVKEKTAAPGTMGYIPLKMSARHSEIDVDYTITWNNKMMEDLKTHIRFFYLVDKTTKKPVVCNLDENGNLTDADQSKFMKTPGTLPYNTERKYLSETDKTIKGTVKMNSEKMIYIYWEWYLDADDAKAKGAITAVDDAIKTQWDELDTDIGRYPAKYYDAMTVLITCTGVQSTPALDTRADKNTGPVHVYETSGS